MSDLGSSSRRSKLKRSSGSLLSGGLSICVFLSIWQAAVTGFEIPGYILPAPINVWRALVAGLVMDPTARASFWYQLADTMHATAWGFVIGSLAGVALAALMSEFPVFERILLPYIVGFQSMPKVAIAPLFVIWFGYQIESKIAMSVTVTLFPVLLNSLEGFATVERERLELLTSLDASRFQSFWLIKLPSALPFIFAGLNLGIVYALLGTIVAEFIGAQRGMGVIITQLQSVSDTAGVFAALIILSVSGYVLIAAVRAIQHRFVFWSGSGRVSEKG